MFTDFDNSASSLLKSGGNDSTSRKKSLGAKTPTYGLLQSSGGQMHFQDIPGLDDEEEIKLPTS
jgi:hypothetical protein